MHNRKPSLVQKNAVAEFLRDLLLCNVDRLPTELVAHGFWYIEYHFVANQTSASVRLAQCVNTLRNLVKMANHMLSPVCGKRFGDRVDDRHELCRRMLTDADFRSSNKLTSITFDKYR